MNLMIVALCAGIYALYLGVVMYVLPNRGVRVDLIAALAGLLVTTVAALSMMDVMNDG